MSQKLGCSRASYAYYETDKNTPDINFIRVLHDLPELKNIPELSGVSFDYLLGYDVPRKLENTDVVKRFGLSERSIKALDTVNTNKRFDYIKRTINLLLEDGRVLMAIGNFLFFNLREKSRRDRSQGPREVNVHSEYKYGKVGEDIYIGNYQYGIGLRDLITNDMFKRTLMLGIQEQLFNLLEKEDQQNPLPDRLKDSITK